MMSRHWQPLQIFFVIDLILGMVCSNENPPVIRDNKALELAREPNLGNIFNFGESFGSRLQTMQSDESSQFTVIDAEFLLGLFKNKTSLGENEKSKSSITPEARDFTGIGRPKTFLPPNQKRRRRLFKKSHNKTQDHLSSNPNLFAREGGVNEFGPNSHNVSPLPHRLKKGRSFSISTTKRPLTLVPLVYKPGPAVIRVFPNPEDVKLAGLVSRNENKALKKGQLLDHASQMEILKVKENLPLKILEENGKIQATSIKPKSIFGHTNLQEYGFSDGDNMALYVESSYNPTYTVPPRFHFVKGDFTNLEFRKYNVSTPNNEVKLQGRSDDADIQQARLIMSSPLSDILRLSPTSSSFIHPTSPPPYFLADTLGHGENSKTPISGRPSLRPHVPNDVINDPLSSRPEFHGIMNNQFSHQPNIHRDMHRSQLPVSRHAQNEIPEQPFPLRPPPLPNKGFPAKPLAPGLRQDQSHSSTPLNTLARNQLLSRPPFTGAFGEQLPVKPTSHDVPHSRITLSSSNPQIIHQDQLTLKPFPHDTRQNFSPLRDLPFPPGVHQDILKDSRKPFVPISTSPPHPEPHKTDTLSTLPPSLPSSPRPHGPLSLHRSVKAFEPPTVRYSSYQSAISNNDHFHEVGDLHHQSLSYSSIPPLPSLSESTSIRPFSLPITGDPTTLQTHSDPPTTQFRHMEKPPEMLFADPFDDHNFLKESVDPSSVIYFTFQPEDLSPTNPDFTSIPPIHHDEEKLNPPVSPPSELQLSHPSDFPVFHESLKTSLPPFTQTPSPIPSSSYSTHSPPPVSSTFPPPPIFPSSPPPFSSTHPPSFHSTSPHPPPSPPTPPSPPPPPPSPPPPTSSHPPISTYSSPLPLSFHSSSPRPSTPFTSSHPPSFPSTSIPPPPPPRYPSSRPPTFHTTTLSPPPLPIFPSSRPPPFHSTSLPPPPPPYFPSSRPPTFHSTSLLPPNFPSSHPPSVHSTTHLPPPPIPSSLRPSFQSISPPRFSSSSRPSFPPPPPFPSTLPPSIPSKTFPPPPSYPPFSFHSTPLPLQPPHFSPPKRPPPPQQNNHLSSKPHGHFDRPFNTGITQHPTFGAKDLNGHFNPTTLGPTHTVLKPRPVFSNIPRHPKPVFVSNNQEHIPSKQLNKPPRFEHFEGTNQDYGHPSNNEIVGRISGIPGVANIDYPAYSFVPKTSFNCIGRVIGYYADPEAECQVFHMCEFGNRHNSFLCPNGTLFSQEILTCDHWRNVDCGRSSNLYHLNQKIYNVQDTITSPYRWKKHAKINLENDQIQNQEDLQARDDPPASHHPPFSSVRSKPENSFPSKKNPLFIITHSRPLGKTFLITTAAPAAFTELLKTNTSFSSSLPHSSTSPPPPPSTSTFSPLPSPPPTPPPPPPPPGVTTVSEEVEFSPEVQSMKPHIVNPLKVKPFLP